MFAPGEFAEHKNWDVGCKGRTPPPRAAFQGPVPDAFDYAYDREPGWPLPGGSGGAEFDAGELKLIADRITAGPIVACKLLIDHSHVKRVLVVCFRKGAAFEKRYLQGAEIIGAYDS